MNLSKADDAKNLLGYAAECLKMLRTRNESTAFTELEAVVANLQSALEWSLSVDQPETGARLALALGQYVQRRGFFRDAAQYLDIGISLVESLPPRLPSAESPDVNLVRAGLLRERSSVHLDFFEWRQATERAGEALLIFGAAGEGDGVCACLNLQRLAAFHRDEIEEARDLFRQAHDGYQRTGNTLCTGIVLHNMGLVESHEGNKAEAARLLSRALELRRNYGDLRGLAETSNNLGVLAQERNDLEEAAEHYTAALLDERALRHNFGMARALHNLGEVSFLQHDNLHACRLVVAAERLFEQVGSPYVAESAELLQRIAGARGLSPAELDAMRLSLNDKSPGEMVDWALPPMSSN